MGKQNSYTYWRWYELALYPASFYAKVYFPMPLERIVSTATPMVTHLPPSALRLAAWGRFLCLFHHVRPLNASHADIYIYKYLQKLIKMLVKDRDLRIKQPLFQESCVCISGLLVFVVNKAILSLFGCLNAYIWRIARPLWPPTTVRERKTPLRGSRYLFFFLTAVIVGLLLRESPDYSHILITPPVYK